MNATHPPQWWYHRHMDREEIIKLGRWVFKHKLGRGGTLREGEPIPAAPTLTDTDRSEFAAKLGRAPSDDDLAAFEEGFNHPYGR